MRRLCHGLSEHSAVHKHRSWPCWTIKRRACPSLRAYRRACQPHGCSSLSAYKLAYQHHSCSSLLCQSGPVWYSAQGWIGIQPKV